MRRGGKAILVRRHRIGGHKRTWICMAGFSSCRRSTAKTKPASVSWRYAIGSQRSAYQLGGRRPGLLLTYGQDASGPDARAMKYIVRGAKPSDLPVEQATKLERRVGEDVATLTPHGTGRADFPLPVLHGRASLTQ